MPSCMRCGCDLAEDSDFCGDYCATSYYANLPTERAPLPAPPPATGAGPGPLTLEAFAAQIETLRTAALFGCDDHDGIPDAGLDPLCEQELIACLSHLQLAHAAAVKARLHQSRALAASPYRQ